MPLKQNWTDRDTVTATFLNQLASAVNSAVASLAGKYTKPAGGIPASDLAGNVLDKTTADTIYAKAFPASQVIAIDPATGNVTSVTTNGVATTYTYNADGTVHTDTRAGVTRTYTYDGSGNLTGIASS
ncbi:hypothetical protein [Gordonia jacobaea]|uniref:hypothetical protein n=1 Tax=Gordonia jacobaea TaxID=122202 RepID=UPI0022E10E36|nr:hypothetical protein [Gordonia jacobaea]